MWTSKIWKPSPHFLQTSAYLWQPPPLIDDVFYEWPLTKNLQNEQPTEGNRKTTTPYSCKLLTLYQLKNALCSYPSHYNESSLFSLTNSHWAKIRLLIPTRIFSEMTDVYINVVHKSILLLESTKSVMLFHDNLLIEIRDDTCKYLNRNLRTHFRPVWNSCTPHHWGLPFRSLVMGRSGLSKNAKNVKII